MKDKEHREYRLMFPSSCAGFYQHALYVAIPIDNLTWLQRKLWKLLGIKIEEVKRK